MLNLAIEKRDKATKLHAIRMSGKIPAVFYGRKESSTPIAVSEKDFMKAWKEAGESSVIVLTGAEGEHQSLIHDIDLDPVTGKVRHVDFYVVEKGKKIQVGVPIEFEGVAPGVKELGGTLVKVLHELEIEATPADLPHEITIDISSLVNFESQILAKDIKLPNGVTLITGPEEVVALVQEVKEEAEEVAPVDISAIELSEKKGKKDEEGEAGDQKGGGEGETASK
jgi:large subunit ribosomal protein L25